jgi:hypothetical protein
MAEDREKEVVPKGAGCPRSVVGVGLGLALGALAGIVVGSAVGVAAAVILGIL